MDKCEAKGDFINWGSKYMWLTLTKANRLVPGLLAAWFAMWGILYCPGLGMADNTPPNIVLIMADDMSDRELPSYGNTRHVMPTLGRLAEEGIQFATAFATPICWASRYELFTGQYGFRSRVFNNRNRRAGAFDRVAERIRSHVTFSQLLKDGGYATAVAGKWGMTGRVPTLAAEIGFDEYMIYATTSRLPDGVEHT